MMVISWRDGDLQKKNSLILLSDKYTKQIQPNNYGYQISRIFPIYCYLINKSEFFTLSDKYSHGLLLGLSSPPIMKNLFSVPIFFIVFRETLEAAIIVSVLLGLVQQIVRRDPERLSVLTTSTVSDRTKREKSDTPPVETTELERRRLIRKLRFQVTFFVVLLCFGFLLSRSSDVRYSLVPVWAFL